jgi:Tfp pilus assembly PilM family ATPase
MNILNLLIKEKHVAGIEINDLVIRVTFFRPRKRSSLKTYEGLTKPPKNELILIEEQIPPNVISNGIVVDKDTLAKILKKIWIRENLIKSYAIVSVPEDKIYSRIFNFPKNIDEKQLEQAINLAIDFQLPFKKNEIYTGWENNNNSNKVNEILISAIPKNIADSYIEVLNTANISVLALESHIASIARSIKLNKGETTLITKKNQYSVTIFSVKDNIVQFSRTLPLIYVKEDEKLLSEVNKIKISLESELNEEIKEIPLTEVIIIDEYLIYPEIATHIESKWLVSLGAFIRGEIPMGKDFQISLLPIGTVKAYEFQKTKTFITLIRTIIIDISIFFLFAFVAAYFLIFSLSQIINNKANISISPIAPDVIEKELLIKKVNSFTSVGQSFLANTVNWSILIDEINTRTINGITISSFSAQSINDTMSIVGIAVNRDTLNKFKKSLQDSSYLSTVELPITNLEQKGDIPFSISFRVKDPIMFYYK